MGASTSSKLRRREQAAGAAAAGGRANPPSSEARLAKRPPNCHVEGRRATSRQQPGRPAPWHRLRFRPSTGWSRASSWTTRRRARSWPSASMPSPPARRAELVWLLEHPPLYTAGTSAKAADLIEPGRFPVHRSGRGGQFTYHGPGQRVGYVMLDVARRWGDVRAYVDGAGDARSSMRWRRSGWRRTPAAAWSASGCAGRRGRASGRTRSRRSACGCGAGSARTASASTWRRTWRTSPASCRAASAMTGSRAWPSWGRARAWRRSTARCAELSSAASARPARRPRAHRPLQRRQALAPA